MQNTVHVSMEFSIIAVYQVSLDLIVTDMHID
jgi:hypothetical protein